MDDLISRQGAIDTVEFLHEQINEWIEDAIEDINSLPDAQSELHWIPVSKRLPEIARRVLVTLSDGHVMVAEYYSIERWTLEPTGHQFGYDKEIVLAWMPLPKPYGGET